MAQPRENEEQALKRWHDLELLQQAYPTFDIFLQDVIEGFMGFICTEVQLDIGDWVANGPQFRMVQAQRGEAKTTITAAYAVWRCIHNPSFRILIVSAGSDMATEIANWIIQIIEGMDVLECLRPDRSQGDRSSVTAYDIHYSLKGPEKSASITCIGITSSMQGKRADLIIADDVESAKNSQTATQQIRIAHLTKDFTSICSTGDIVWLGTPQSMNSLYNGLPGRGVAIRIWPGRYPTIEEEPSYGIYLAPLIKQRMTLNPSLRRGGGFDGSRGKPTDPVLLNEDQLTKKEIDQGASYFQLQHMLCTALTDELRFPLKISQIRFLDFDVEQKMGPMTIGFVRTSENEIKGPEGWPLLDKMYRVQKAEDMAVIKGWYMYIDPAGGGANNDETAYAITGFSAGRCYVACVGAVPGGINESSLQLLTDVVEIWKPDYIGIEKNFGNGALCTVLTPMIKKVHATCGIEELWETGQKELRIIDILEPVIGSGKLVMMESSIAQDWQHCQKYPTDLKQTYSLFHQLARITRDKGALIHEDRLDALAGSVRHWVEALGVDELKAKLAAQRDNWNKMMQDPLGTGRPMPNFPFGGLKLNPTMLSKFRLPNENHLRRNPHDTDRYGQPTGKQVTGYGSTSDYKPR